MDDDYHVIIAPVELPESLKQAWNTLKEYMWHDEKTNQEEGGNDPNHIFKSLQCLAVCLGGTK